MVLFSFLVGCVSVPVAVPLEERSQEVTLTVPRDEAMGMVVNAFLEHGLAIGEARASLVVSLPQTLNPGATFRLEATIRAILLPTDGGTSVRIMGTFQSPDAQTLARSISGSEFEADRSPISARCKGACGEAWQLIQRIAESLKERMAS